MQQRSRASRGSRRADLRSQSSSHRSSSQSSRRTFDSYEPGPGESRGTSYRDDSFGARYHQRSQTTQPRSHGVLPNRSHGYMNAQMAPVTESQYTLPPPAPYRPIPAPIPNSEFYAAQSNPGASDYEYTQPPVRRSTQSVPVHARPRYGDSYSTSSYGVTNRTPSMLRRRDTYYESDTPVYSTPVNLEALERGETSTGNFVRHIAPGTQYDVTDSDFDFHRFEQILSLGYLHGQSIRGVVMRDGGTPCGLGHKIHLTRGILDTTGERHILDGTAHCNTLIWVQQQFGTNYPATSQGHYDLDSELRDRGLAAERRCLNAAVARLACTREEHLRDMAREASEASGRRITAQIVKWRIMETILSGMISLLPEDGNFEEVTEPCGWPGYSDEMRQGQEFDGLFEEWQEGESRGRQR